MIPDSSSVQHTRLSAAKQALLEKRLHGKSTTTLEHQVTVHSEQTGTLRLSFAQQRLWFLEQFEGQNCTYTIPLGFRLTGPLNVAVLKRSLEEIVRRHEVLRTTFIQVDGKPDIVVTPVLELPFSEQDFRMLPIEQREAEARRLALEAGRHRFLLSEPPLFRCALLRTDNEEALFLMIVHHIIFDGWSMDVFLRELSFLYPAFLRGISSPLPELMFQYADFAQWQRDWLKGEYLNSQLSYWKKQLAGSPPVLELPTDHTRPPRQTFRGDIYECVLPSKLVEQLYTVSSQEGCTLFMTLLAAFAVLLYRYSGQEDLLIGSPVANRVRCKIEGLIGCFVNMVVLRSDVSGNPSFRELLHQIRCNTLEAQMHQDIPFDLLVEELHPERNLSHHPLFQVAFALRSLPESFLRFSGIDLHPVSLHNSTAKFDLFLEVVETGHSVYGRFEYSTDIFEPDTIRRMSKSFLALLEGIAATPERHITELPVLLESDLHQLLTEQSERAVENTQTTCLHQWFEWQAQKTPNSVAVVSENRVLSYKELNQRANQLARYFRKLGVGQETLVGMCIERSLEMIIGILGILKAGGAYVPIELTYPRDRVGFILTDSQAPVIITQKKYAQDFTRFNVHVVCIDADWEVIAEESQENLVNQAAPENLAYVIYTSGSTGKPKGALVTHYNVVRLFTSTQSWFSFTDQDIWTFFHSYAFDFSVWELWGALLYGGKLIIVSYETSRSPETFYALVCKEKVTVLNQTPSAFRQFMKVDDELGDIYDNTLRLIIFGGESLDVQTLKPWFQRHGDVAPQLINMYGITETTVHVTYYPITMQTLMETEGSVIGCPLPDLQVYILDTFQQIVPLGVPGELCVSGAGLAKGYLNRTTLTQEKFIPHPFDQKPGTRLYRSGDLARYLPDGNIEFLGRIDHQVKIRGFRIELGEIESVLLQHQAIREAVVIAREGVSGDKQLAAYVVVRPEHPVSVRDLRDVLKTQLPDYMIPATFTFLDTLPLTPNGKIDRHTLPEPDAIRPDAADTFVAPRTQAEESMTKLWRFLLNVDQIGIYDNFFELGGHSLLAVKLMAEIETLFQVKLPLWKLFEAPTIAGLAVAIAAEQWIGPDKPALEEQPIDPQVEALLDETIHPDLGINPHAESESGLKPAISEKEGALASFNFETRDLSLGNRPTAIFLTGATGFLGAFLLHELLQQTPADIYCLVRAASAEEGQQRLRATLRKYDIWFPALARRIVAVPGDLARPKFGLTDDQFDQLARQIDVIYHSGAQVNLVYPYAALKAVNVGGAQEVLRLAALRKVKPVHHVSTTGVFLPFSCNDQKGEPTPTPPKRGNPLPGGVGVGSSNEPIAEDTPLPPFESLTVGYAQSKWVAEKLMAAAHARGIPCSIYRPSRITGHSRTGVWNTDDFAGRMIKGCLEMGVAPEQHILTENWAPVDYVSQAIVHLSRTPAARGQIFHLVNRHPLEWPHLLAWFGAVGYPLKIIPYARWRDFLCHRAAANALFPLKPIFAAAEPVPDPPQRFACWNTVAGLEHAGLACPPVDAALLHTYTAYWLRQKFLTPPARPA